MIISIITRASGAGSSPAPSLLSHLLLGGALLLLLRVRHLELELQYHGLVGLSLQVLQQLTSCSGLHDAALCALPFGFCGLGSA